MYSSSELQFLLLKKISENIGYSIPLILKAAWLILRASFHILKRADRQTFSLHRNTVARRPKNSNGEFDFS